MSTITKKFKLHKNKSKDITQAEIIEIVKNCSTIEQYLSEDPEAKVSDSKISFTEWEVYNSFLKWGSKCSITVGIKERDCTISVSCSKTYHPGVIGLPCLLFPPTLMFFIASWLLVHFFSSKKVIAQSLMHEIEINVSTEGSPLEDGNLSEQQVQKKVRNRKLDDYLALSAEAQELSLKGLSYEEGDGVKKNLAKAEKLYREAAELGVDHAMQNLGEFYLERRNGKDNYGEAYYWLKLSLQRDPLNKEVKSLLDAAAKKLSEAEIRAQDRKIDDAGRAA